MDLVVRAAVAFLFVYFLTRVIGRRELSSMEPFDLIMLVMIGDLVQQGVTQNDFSVTGAFLVGGTIALLTVAVSYLELPVPAAPAAARRRAGDRRRGRQADRPQPATQPDHARGARRGGPPGGHRLARAGPLGRPRDQRPAELHRQAARRPRRAALPLRSRRRSAAHAGRRGAGDRGELPAARRGRGRERAARRRLGARRRLVRDHGRRGPRARLRRAEVLHGGRGQGGVRRLPLRARERPRSPP